MIDPDLSIMSKRTVGKRIAANTGLMVGAKTLGVILGLGSLLLATKFLDASALGIIIFLHAYMLFFSEVATFQSWQGIIRYGTDDLKENNCEGLAGLLNFGIKLDALSAGIAFIASVSVFSLIVGIVKAFPDLFGSTSGLDIETLRNYAAAYCVLVLLRQRGTSIGIFRLFDKFHILAIKALIMPTVRFIGVIIAVLTDAGFTGFLLAWFSGSLLAYIYLPFMALLELKRRGLLAMVFRSKAKFLSPRKGVWPFVIKSNIDSTLAAANLHLPVLLVMSVFGSTWVAVYRIAEEVAKLLSEGFVLLDQVIYPELAKMVSSGETAKIWRLVTRAAVMLLSFGLVMSLIVMVIGPSVLSRLFSADYAVAAPLASLLVPAAALLGTAAPLYPVLYAANRPERAIYARGTGVLVYIVSFFIFSFTIGKMAPGWAALLGNATAVALVILLAKHTLKKTQSGVSFPASEKDNQTMRSADDAQSGSICPTVAFTGESTARLWGLPVHEWQRRAFKKIGADIETTSETGVILGVNWVLSTALATAMKDHPQTALVDRDPQAGGVIVATHGINKEQAQALIGHPPDAAAMKALGLAIKTPDDLALNYNKALRKTDHPYAMDINTVAPATIMQRQFDSSYKGITDFVTKFIWPLPAYYVTRFCAHWRMTPNFVTTIGLILMFVALYCFWQGQWALGFMTGWMMTFLDTVDGKLARTTMTYSAWGNVYDHGIDLIHPPFWYWAWYVGLGGIGITAGLNAGDPMTLALIAIFVGYVVDRIIEGIFIAQHGFHIHVWRPLNSALRFVTARRNPNMFIFMIGILASVFFAPAAVWGFYAVAIWTWACILFNVGVVIVAALSRKPVVSWMDGA